MRAADCDLRFKHATRWQWREQGDDQTPPEVGGTWCSLVVVVIHFVGGSLKPFVGSYRELVKRVDKGLSTRLLVTSKMARTLQECQ